MRFSVRADFSTILALVLLVMVFSIPCQAQTVLETNPETVLSLNPNHRPQLLKKDSVKQVDAIDVIHQIFKRKNASVSAKADSIRQNKKVKVSVLPAPGLSLTTGFAILFGGNVIFYTDSDHVRTKLSTVLTNITFTAKTQILFPMQFNIWSPNNKYNFVTDWRFLHFPQETFGFGGNTNFSDGYTIDYNYFRFYNTVLRKITDNFYGGLGFNYDYFFGIHEDLPAGHAETVFDKYSGKNYERSAGLTLDALYDSRPNPIFATKGWYANLIYRRNYKFLGSESRWNSLVLDLRKYVSIPGTRSVFAFWNYDWLTLGGKPPYFNLPATGTDLYNNTGRGYVQGRFRDKQMVYLESEFRYSLTRNGLLGGVLFVNAQSYSRDVSKQFATINPGYGLGLRVKLNKFSHTNVCIDYGFGSEGSRGFFVNVGELF